jgi:hypothetical protein
MKRKSNKGTSTRGKRDSKNVGDFLSARQLLAEGIFVD